MADNFGTAGFFSLDEFRIISLTENLEADILNHVHNFNIHESMSKGYLSGSAEIYDSVGILYDFPLKGEEILVIKYRDFYKQEQRDEMIVYSVDRITDTKNGSDVMIKYRINFVSLDKYITDAIDLQRGFNNMRYDEMVETIFDDYYGNGNPKKKLEHNVQTEGKHTVVIPKYTPTKALEFITRRAITPDLDNDTQTVRFFETRKGFYFTTHDELNRGDTKGMPLGPNELVYQYGSLASFGGDGGNEQQERLMTEILEWSYPEHVNTIRDMTQGGYRRRVTQLDFINRSYLPDDYDHLEYLQKYQLPDGKDKAETVHNEDFVDKYMKHREEILVLKDYPAIGESGSSDQYFRNNTFYPEAYNKKIANYYHHNAHKTTIKIYGRQDLTPGCVITLNLPKMIYDDLGKQQRKNDERRIGSYLIESINNVFYEDTYYQILEISKSGYRKE